MHPAAPAAHPHLVLMLRRALLGGLAALVLFPVTRGYSEWLGWLPLWLVLMPAAALWVAEGLPLPRRLTSGVRRRRAQAVRLRRS